VISFDLVIKEADMPTTNGTNGNDYLTAGPANYHTIFGLNGDDTIVSAQGYVQEYVEDIFDGGLGSDTFVFVAGAKNFSIVEAEDGFPTATDSDTLTFEAGIELSDLLFSVSLSHRPGLYIAHNDGNPDLTKHSYAFIGGQHNSIRVEYLTFADGSEYWMHNYNGVTEIRAIGWNLEIFAGQGQDGLVRFFGAGGNDTIHGNDALASNPALYTGADYLHGLSGDDQIFGYGGNDTLHGGSDNDLLSGGQGDDVLDGGNGSDSLYGAEGNDLLYGGHGN